MSLEQSINEWLNKSDALLIQACEFLINEDPDYKTTDYTNTCKNIISNYKQFGKLSDKQKRMIATHLAYFYRD